MPLSQDDHAFVKETVKSLFAIPESDLDEDAGRGLDALSALERIQPTGWLANATYDDEISRTNILRAFTGEPKLRPSMRTSRVTKTPKDAILRARMADMQKKLRKANKGDRANYAPRVRIADAENDFDSENAAERDVQASEVSEESDLLGEQLASARLREYLLKSVRPLLEQGLQNASADNERSSVHTIKEPVEGLEIRPQDGGPGFSLMPHQRDGVGRWEYLMRKFRAAVLGDDMGLGKTVTIVAIVARAVQRSEYNIFLIVVPPGLVEVWQEEFRRAPHLRVAVFDRSMTTQQLYAHHVIIASFGVIQSMYGVWETSYIHRKAVQEGFEKQFVELQTACQEIKSQHEQELDVNINEPGSIQRLDVRRPDIPLLNINFTQIIMDEAHAMRNSATILAKGMRLLSAGARGVVTGTPLQNDIRDFRSILSFLKVEPFSDSGLFLSCFGRSRALGKAPRTAHFDELNDTILSGIRACLTIRRTRDQKFDGNPIIPPGRQVLIQHRITLSGHAADYQNQESVRKLWDTRRRWEVVHATADIPGGGEQLDGATDGLVLATINKARLHVLHPKLFSANYGGIGREGADSGTELPQDEALNSQPLSQNPRARFRQEFRESPGSWHSDSLCHLVLQISLLLDNRRQEASSMDTASSKSYLSKHKVLVFCESLAALDLVEIGLEEGMQSLNDAYSWCTPIQCHRFDGTSSRRERTEMRRRFQELDDQGNPKDWNDPNTAVDPIMVMLITNGAGGEGITLTNASDVFLLGPSWNPFSEDQCIARAARLGRGDTVTVHRLKCLKSIHKRITHRQAIKRATFSGVMGNGLLHKHREELKAITDSDLLEAVGWSRAEKALNRGKIAVPLD